jgi:hypothetical protein
MKFNQNIPVYKETIQVRRFEVLSALTAKFIVC